MTYWVNAITLYTKYLYFLTHMISLGVKVSTYTTPSQTIVGDALGVRILVSVVRNLNLSLIHLLPLLLYQIKIPVPSPQFFCKQGTGEIKEQSSKDLKNQRFKILRTNLRV